MGNILDSFSDFQRMKNQRGINPAKSSATSIYIRQAHIENQIQDYLKRVAEGEGMRAYCEEQGLPVPHWLFDHHTFDVRSTLRSMGSRSINTILKAWENDPEAAVRKLMRNAIQDSRIWE